MSTRTYLVGAPVWVTVDDETGRVTYTIDTSEVASAIRESGHETEQDDDGPATDGQIESDAQTVEIERTRRTLNFRDGTSQIDHARVSKTEVGG